MKANRAWKERPGDRAEVGVGTLIVFIAMVLVAAVAAAVLINTTGTLQQRAQSTGKEATQEVSSNLKVVNVFGTRNDTTTSEVHKLKVLMELSAGAVPMDLTKIVIRFSDGSTSFNFDYGYDGGNGFNTSWIRGTNNSAVMQSGDLVELEFHTWPAVADIAPRTTISLSLIPEAGSAVVADFRTPATYGSDKVITLR